MISEIQTKAKELLSALYDLNRQVAIGAVELNDEDCKAVIEAINCASEIEMLVEDLHIVEECEKETREEELERTGRIKVL